MNCEPPYEKQLQEKLPQDRGRGAATGVVEAMTRMTTRTPGREATQAGRSQGRRGAAARSCQIGRMLGVAASRVELPERMNYDRGIGARLGETSRASKLTLTLSIVSISTRRSLCGRMWIWNERIRRVTMVPWSNSRR
jgi:hypothetical protein